MFRKIEARHIDLHLPKGWAQCTTDELECIASSIISVQLTVDRYHPFDWDMVKLQAVLSMNRINVIRQADSEKQDIANVTYLVRREDEEPWEINIGQLYSLCEGINWITEDSNKNIFLFPYPEIIIGKKKLKGPPPLLDGYTWRDFRWLTDWMQLYLAESNAKRDANTARSQFLAILFHLDGDDNATADPSLFSDFDPIKWQVVLLWWSSLMAQLEKKFRRVFKKQAVKGRKAQKDTPWDFYNCVIANIQKYVGGLSEQDVNNASYGTILQQLEMMARESEEMERINKKYNHKK